MQQTCIYIFCPQTPLHKAIVIVLLPGVTSVHSNICGNFVTNKPTLSIKMPKVLPPYPIDTPSYIPGMAVSVEPPTSKHSLWLEDYEYYDQLGRDPLQQRRIWGIADQKVRVEKVMEVLEEYPKQMHRRKILLKAIVRGDEDVVRCLVKTGMRVCSDLEKARREEEKEKEDEMNDVNADNVSLPDKDDASVAPMHVAAVQGHIPILKIMLENGVHVDVLDEFGRTPLLAAALSNRPEAIKFLLAHGADATARASGNELAQEYLGKLAACNALEAIARRGDVEMLTMLLEIPSVEITPLAIWSVAVGNNNYHALRLLLERGGCLALGEDEFVVIDENAELRQALIDAVPDGIHENDLQSLKLLLSLGYPKLRHGNIWPVQIPEELHKRFIWGAYTAIDNDQPDKFEFIYNLGLKEHDSMSLDDLPEGQHLNLQHLLDDAAAHGSINCVRILIEKYGADPNKYRTPPCITPLYFAAGNDKPDVVRYFLEKHNVDIQVGNGTHAEGPTALWVAITHKSLESVALLLQYGGPLNEIDTEITNIKGPLDAVLIASQDGQVRFETETKVRGYIDDARHNYSTPNSSYVRVALDVGNKDWIEKLQYREADDEVRNGGREKAKMFPECPIFQERYDELNKDDDLIPKFRAAFKEV
jgi:ankyrin repeat protein